MSIDHKRNDAWSFSFFLKTLRVSFYYSAGAAPFVEH